MMETGLRILLLLIGIAIIAGIIWDFRRHAAKKHAKASFNRDRTMEDDLVLDLNLEPTFESAILKTPVIPKSLKTEVEPFKEGEIVLIHVMARRPNLFTGDKILETFHESHLFYNDDQVFDRYENIDGTGNSIFSVVSAIEPGIFEISKMSHFKTPGITLFFAITRPNQAIAAFELMLRTARLLATRLSGELKDDKHQLLTANTIEHVRDRIRQQPLMVASIHKQY